MDRGNIFSGGSFRATLYGAVAFLLVLALSGVFAIRFIEHALLAETRDQFATTAAALQAEYEVDDTAEFLDAVLEMSVALEKFNRFAVLYDANGTRVVGHHDVTPDFTGWTVRAVADENEPGPAQDHYMTALKLGDHTLVMGRDMAFVQHFERVTVQAFLAVGAAMTLVMMFIGYRISRAVQSKLESMGETLHLVAMGETGARLVVSSDNDQIDRIARIMNSHLDTLSRLMETTKSSAAAVAHDLKRPLARASLALEAALDDADLQEVSRTHIEDAQTELSRLTAIFETIMRIARIDAGQGQVAGKSVDLGELAADLGETFQVVAEESGQKLDIKIDAGASLVIPGDQGMISQLIVNLLQNAVTHCPPGTIITLGVQGGPDQVILTVADTGPGIADADREHLFDLFFRADAARVTEGSGLGLALVKSIAERHGAAVSLADNHPGLRVAVTFSRRVETS